ncbi:MAG: Mth938-like domain-containing protein [Mariprofundaceae bacterium]
MLFTGYGDDWLRVNERRFEAGLALYRDEILCPWGPESIARLEPAHLDPLLDPLPEVLIIGSGRRTAFPSAVVLAWLAERHVGWECMDSRSAARTYNILVGEGRQIVAALLRPDA